MSAPRSNIWMRTRSALGVAALYAGVALSPGVVWGQSRSLEQLNKVENPAVLAAQGEFISALQRYAAAHAARESPEYWAIINANLARSREAVGGGARSLSGSPTPFIVPDPKARSAMSADAIRVTKSYVGALSNGARIFNGKPSLPAEFVEVVSIAARHNDVFTSFCSGTLVAPGTVLTAAHCVCESEFEASPGPAIVFGSDVNRPDGIIAAYDVDFSVTMHGDYCQNYRVRREAAMAGRDLAIVRFNQQSLVKGASPPQGFAPVRIATWQLLFGRAIEEMQLVGFGYTENNILGEKRITASPIVDLICSAESEATRFCALGRESVAIDGLTRHDTCGGDSGGPAFIYSGSTSYFLAAVTSRGGKCGSGGVYSLVTPEALRWMATLNIDLIMCDTPSRCLRRADR
jgi:hypothetical protein